MIEFAFAAILFSRSCTQILTLFVVAAILKKNSSSRRQIGHVISAECQSLLSCRCHIGNREDPWNEAA